MIKLVELLSEKIKGVDGKACWKGYRYAGTENGKDKCVPMNEMGKEDLHYKYIANLYEKGDADMKDKIAAIIEKVSGNKHKETNIDTIKADLLELDKDDIDYVEEELGIDPFKEPVDEAFFIGEGKTIECGKCGWRWELEDSEENGETNPYLCHKCDYDNSYKYNDEINEYDVDETNLSEVKDFVKFMKEYTSFLAEAQCDCIMEAEYHGRKVQLGKPMQGDIKKFKVYVKNNKGKVVKVNFGFGGKSAKGKRMVIKAKNPKRRSAYRKRHHCDNPGPRWKANYWSCRKW